MGPVIGTITKTEIVSVDWAKSQGGKSCLANNKILTPFTRPFIPICMECVCSYCNYSNYRTDCSNNAPPHWLTIPPLGFCFVSSKGASLTHDNRPRLNKRIPQRNPTVISAFLSEPNRASVVASNQTHLRWPPRFPSQGSTRTVVRQSKMRENKRGKQGHQKGCEVAKSEPEQVPMKSGTNK